MMDLIIRNKKRGQTLVEFAIVLPVLIFIVMFVFDLGRALYYSSAVSNIAREGARFGIIHPDDTAGIHNAASALAVGLDPANLNISSFKPTPKTIRVNVTYQFYAVTPVVWDYLASNPLELKSQSTMPIEK